MGRPRSAEARVAVLHAVDDLLREVGYAAMTMKGIAERAGVGQQIVYPVVVEQSGGTARSQCGGR